jgi:hypothetical protein
VTRINEAPEPKSVDALAVEEPASDEIPSSPPPEVLDSLDRAARVLSELGREGVTVALEPSPVDNSLRFMLHHPGAPSTEISHGALLDLLDGEPGSIPGARRP